MLCKQDPLSSFLFVSLSFGRSHHSYYDHPLEAMPMSDWCLEWLSQEKLRINMFLKCLSFGVVSVNGQYLLYNQKPLCWGTLLFIFQYWNHRLGGAILQFFSIYFYSFLPYIIRGYYQMSESEMAIIKPEVCQILLRSFIY